MESLKHLNEGMRAEGGHASFPQFRLIPDSHGVFFVCLSLVLLAFGRFVPVVPILIFYAIWGTQLLKSGLPALHIRSSLLPIFSLLCMCLLSVFWSGYTNVTLYNSVAFTTMMVCVVIASRIVSAHAFVKGVSLGLLVVLLVTLGSGEYSTVYATGKPALVGFFGQKNTVGALSAIGLLAGFFMVFYSRGWKERFYAGLMPACVAFTCLYLSLSVASLFAALAGMGALVAMYFVTRFPAGLRLLILCLMAGCAGSLCLAIFALDIDVIGMVLQAVDKNPTLTGRTDVWAKGIERALDKPFFGYGYKAFWQPGNPYAEEYWVLFKSPTQNSFHFHSLYLESFVQLGGFGFLFFAAIFIYAFARCIVLICLNGMEMELAACLAFITMFFVRSLAEVELLGPFGARVFVFYVLLQKLLEWAPEGSILKAHR